MKHLLMGGGRAGKNPQLQSELAAGRIPHQIEHAVNEMRREIVATVGARQSSTSGALVVGAHGSGHLQAVHLALQDLTPGPRVVRLVGTEYGKSVPFGALLALLGPDLAEDDLEIGPVVRNLGQRVAAEDLVLVLEHCQLIDASTLAVVSHLLASGSARAVIATESLASVPEELRSLARSGVLRLLKTQQLTRAQVRQVVMDLLGCQPSVLANEYLFRLSAGHLGWLLAVVLSSLESGSLAVRGTAVVLTEKPLRPAPALRSLATLVATGLGAEPRQRLWDVALDPAAAKIPATLDLMAAQLEATGYIETQESSQEIITARIRLLLACLAPDGELARTAVLPMNPRQVLEGKLPDYHPLAPVMGQLRQATADLVGAPQSTACPATDLAREVDLVVSWFESHHSEAPAKAVVMRDLIEHHLVRGGLTELENVLERLEPRVEDCPQALRLLMTARSLVAVIHGRQEQARSSLEIMAAQAAVLEEVVLGPAIRELFASLSIREDRSAHRRGASVPQGILELTLSTLSLALNSDQWATRRLNALERLAALAEDQALETLAKIMLLSRGQRVAPLRAAGDQGFLGSLGPHLELVAEARRDNDDQALRRGIENLQLAGVCIRSERMEAHASAAAAAPSRSSAASLPEQHDAQATHRHFPGMETLTARELQMAREVSRGCSNTEIARRFGISPRTVEGHLYQIYAKVCVPHRRALRMLVNGVHLGKDMTSA